MSLHFEHDVAASMREIETVLLTPGLAGPCVPGFSVDTVDGVSVTGRIRVKLAPVPSAYAVRGEIGAEQKRPEKTTIVATGMAEEQRTGHRLSFRARVTLTPAGPARTRCRISVELPNHDVELPNRDEGRSLLDRLLRQFVRRLEDTTLKLPEQPAIEDSAPAHASAEPVAPRPPHREPTARVIGAVAGSTAVVAAAALLVWSRLHHRRERATTF